jgi:hypothetical protein
MKTDNRYIEMVDEFKDLGRALTYQTSIQVEIKSRLTLREERRLRVFENRVLRRVFGPKRDEVT